MNEGGNTGLIPRPFTGRGFFLPYRGYRKADDMFELLKRNRNFRIFFEASCISGIGDYVDDIAFSMLIYKFTESTLITSYVFAIKMILSFVSMFTSTIVDYNNKKKILIVTSFGQGIVLFMLFFIYNTGYISTFILIVFVTIQTIFSTFSTPAQNALLPLLVSDDDAITARASNSMFQQFIQIFSYVGSGALITFVGISGAILIDIVTFFAAGALAFGIQYTEISSKRTKEMNFSQTIKEGFGFIFTSRMIIAILVVTFMGNIFASPVDTLSVAYFSNFFTEKYMYSVFMAAIAIGGIIGTWSLTRLKDRIPMNRLFALGFAVGGCGIMFMFFHHHAAFPVIAGFLYGISNGFVSIMNGVLLQINTPREMMGRVFSAFRCVSFASGPVGMIAVGYLGESVALNKIFCGLGCLLIVTAFVALKYTASSQNKH